MNIEKEKRAISYLKNFQPQDEPYFVCYSGGKDSDVIRILCQLAGVKHELHNNHTTVDAPETVRYIRSIPDIHISYPEYSMWELIVKKKFPPTRLARYCCEYLKERNGQGRMKVTGVRWAESQNRAVNGGFIKIIGKPEKTKEIAKNANANFIKLDKGGWYSTMIMTLRGAS